jgi:hypothetical protein
VKRSDKCVHYNGCALHDTCEAGIPYESVTATAECGRKSLPCTGVLNPAGLATCASRRVPTAEELAAEQAAFKARHEKTMKARAAIVEACGGPWKKGAVSKTGRIDCPACGQANTLAYSRAGYNGHVHAKCSTADCVSWME